MKAASTLVSVMLLVALPALAATDPAGDSLTDAMGQTEDLVFASVEVGSERIHVNVDFENTVPASSYVLSLDTDQDTSTGFQGAFGRSGPVVNHIRDGSLGTDVVVRWDDNTALLAVFEWDDTTGAPSPDVYFDGTLLSGSSVSFPRAIVDDDDGLMNFKVVATEPGGANNTGFLYDVLPDAGLAPATTVVVPEPGGLILIGVAALYLVACLRGVRRG